MSLTMRYQLYNSVKTLTTGLLDSPTTRHIPKFTVTIRRQKVENASSFCPRASPELYKSFQGRYILWNQVHVQSGSWTRTLPSGIRASSNSNDMNQQNVRKGGSLLGGVLKLLFKVAAGLALAAIITVASLPSLLSWPTARRVALDLANNTIPGTVSVKSASLGWTKPCRVEGISLRGSEGEEVLAIPKIESGAPLWSIALGKSGLGDVIVTSPVVDLQSNASNGLPRLALALTPTEKLLENSPGAKRPPRQVKIPSADAGLTVTVKADKGGLEVTDGKLILPGDLAAALGKRLFVNVDLGSSATKESDELKLASNQSNGVPLRATLWSDCAQMDAVGFLQPKASKLKLIKPLKAEMDLTPAFAKFYLAQLNPLLGEILGPAVQDDDMPDIIVQVTPTNMELPSDHYKISIAPIKVTLARGQVIDGVLSLLSKQELAKGKRNLTMQTSVIDAKLDMPGSFDCSRLDVLIADKVHVATWGQVNSIDETVRMTLAIPGPSLRDVMGLTKVPSNYYLKIPVSGTFDKPKVDWKTAGVGLAQLTARQRGGQLMQTFLNYVDTNEKSDVPEPGSKLPWEQSSAEHAQ
ncbi:hypothetical protein MPTK1_1g19380 [Marchantia polymorpha subsp. ruderalis]|uniref:Uncharacterized protein n=2 Tax=Marchantia polymorpha TaxID=3197 RepID=A0AAF6ARV9_MARPO|nr:hypothetical protein MARPO_0001s0277 [Marchantia polymorpha]BBM99179.1 hypothetical protein Mp_1g19380 [Marchantia polymorpha subsp. ruderalis]|eukprot:PTQ50257.1 hypothetical protein MARPO_0001s0277 [Marchantia polymorpha]